MKKIVLYIFFALLLLNTEHIMSQSTVNFKNKSITVYKSKWTQLDTLSIIPLSVQLYFNDSLVDDSLFDTDIINSSIRLKPTFYNFDSVLVNIKYQTFRFKINQPIQRKDKLLIQKTIEDPHQFFKISDDKPISSWNFNDSDLSKNGSISRGISVGNKQNVMINSDLNLQLSGKLSDQFQITAAITDRNIPLQPDGNTQQLQDFDKVYINLFNDKTKITAGDFELQNSPNTFLRFNKKLLGGFFEHKIALSDSNSITVKSAISVSKGKYKKQEISPIDGNQGPYKLVGENQEPFILVIAGSEKVFIDGVLQTRGDLNDYTIDYNVGELIFSPKQIITKEKRIVVEFEYSDKHYSRTFIYNEAQWKTKKSNSYISFYSETDLKNQSIQPELDETQKTFLTTIGDGISNAWYPNFDSVSFSGNEIRYKMIDTICETVFYDSVFVYSTNSDSAFYRLGFTYLGKNSGNYLLDVSLSNGRVYKWIAPINNIPQGEYEPILKLVPPQKKQVLNIGNKTQIGKYASLNTEIALSQNDKNTFSNIQNQDDYGFAFKANYSFEKQVGSKKDSLKQWHLATIFDYELVSTNFEGIEPFRDVEFNRNFGLSNLNTKSNQHTGGISFRMFNTNTKAQFGIKNLNKMPYYNGVQTKWGLSKNYKNVQFRSDGFYLSTSGKASKSKFLKNDAEISYHLKYFSPGIKWKFEDNRLYNPLNDSIYANSSGLNEFEWYIQQNDTAKNQFKLYYLLRFDDIANGLSMLRQSKSNEYGLKLNALTNQNHQLNTNITYRERIRLDTVTTKKESTFASNLDYSGSFLDKVIRTNTFYEAATGQEQKRDYYFLKVNKGTGNFVWNDYNNNGVEELDEFEQSIFSDQGEYIKLWRLTNDYIQTYYSRFSQTINLIAPTTWNNSKGLKGFISLFSNQFTFKSEKKLQNSPIIAFNPFQFNISDTDLVSINQSLRNSFIINQRNPVWNNEIIINKGNSKLFLTGGFEQRTFNNINNVFRITFLKKITSKTDAGIGNKQYTSDQFSTKNNSINQKSIEESISFLLSDNFRLILLYKYVEKQNIKSLNREQLYSTISSSEITWNIPSKGVLNWKISLIKNQYTDLQNTSLAFEMLEGLNVGLNFVTTLSLQSNIGKNLQLQFNYEGRASETSQMVHIGNITLRAYF